MLVGYRRQERAEDGQAQARHAPDPANPRNRVKITWTVGPAVARVPVLPTAAAPAEAPEDGALGVLRRCRI